MPGEGPEPPNPSASAGSAAPTNPGAGPILDCASPLALSHGSPEKTAPEKRQRTGALHINPRSILLPYQLRWADDLHRFKIGLMARQTGKDFSSGAEGIADCYQHELNKDKVDWVIAAPSERQSLESLNKWKDWCEAYKLAIADIVQERYDPLTGETSKNPEALLRGETIIFPGGSRVMAVPGKPDTVRGFSANVLLTEFAFFEDPDATWRAMYPSINNPLRGGPKKLRLISTANGIGNKFHDLWTKNYGVTGATYHCHLVTIHDAVAQGLPINLDELRAGLDDPEGWAQEYECQFLDAAAVLLSYELIALCESAELSEAISPEYWLPTNGQPPVDLGIDFGRKRNLTVCWAAEKIHDLQITKEVLCLQDMPTPEQVEILRPRIRKARRVCLDYTGPGIGLGDYLAKEFGEYDPTKHKFGKVELLTMSNPLKVDIFSKLRMSVEKRSWRLPISRAIREDLHSMQRVATPTGNITYRAPQSEAGHADRCTALALCNRAGGQSGGAMTSVSGIRLGGSRMGRPLFRPRRLA